eukprot:gene18200-32579_t
MAVAVTLSPRICLKPVFALANERGKVKAANQTWYCYKLDPVAELQESCRSLSKR